MGQMKEVSREVETILDANRVDLAAALQEIDDSIGDLAIEGPVDTDKLKPVIDQIRFLVETRKLSVKQADALEDILAAAGKASVLMRKAVKPILTAAGRTA